MRTPPGRFGRLRDRARVRRDGKRDGQLGIPTTNEVAHPPALMAIAQRADEAVADLVRWWAGRTPVCANAPAPTRTACAPPRKTSMGLVPM